MKVLIIGSDGQLGTDLCKVIPKEEQVPLTIADIDITDRDKTLAVIKQHAPDIVINTAAYHNVDDAEDNKDLAFSVNAQGAKNVAEACQQAGAGLVHLSTDYVFDGSKDSPYVESDPPRPLSVYAESKYAGEHYVKEISGKHFIIRSAGLYGAAGCLGKGGTNFVEAMLKRAASQPELRVVTDEIVSPTYTLDLAIKIDQLLRTGQYGIYHIVNHGQCSWHEFTCKIFELLGRQVSIEKVTSAEFKARAKRPKYSVLKNANLAKLGLDDLRPWPEALRAYLNEKEYL
ncbi:dTDP-4-dehydrorhamnose reductase [Candidatus Margulisiibacteriota bacterium]